MDLDSSSKFISSLAKFLQSLCNGYVEFDNGVEVIGHIYLNVDTGKKIDYILNEKVCKTDQNSVTFISNSFHAQPAEKNSNSNSKPSKSTDEPKSSEPGGLNSGDAVMILDDGETKTLTIDRDSSSSSSHNQFVDSPGSLNSKSKRTPNTKRSYNQSFSQYQNKRQSGKQRKSELDSSLNGSNFDTNSLHSEVADSSYLSSQAQDSLNSNPPSISSSAYLQNFGKSSSSDGTKPVEGEISLLEVKEEYDPGLEEAQEAYEESQAHGYGASYDASYYSDGQRGPSQIDFSQSGVSQEEMFQASGDIGDASDQAMLRPDFPPIQSPSHVCPVPGCRVRSVQMRRHWREKHEKYVAVYGCAACPFISKRKNHVVVHALKQHGLVGESAVSGVDYKQNDQFIDPTPYTYFKDVVHKDKKAPIS